MMLNFLPEIQSVSVAIRDAVAPVFLLTGGGRTGFCFGHFYRGYAVSYFRIVVFFAGNRIGLA